MSTPESDNSPLDAASSAASPPGEAPAASEPPAPAQMDRHECAACGYVYEPTKGDGRSGVAPGTSFEDLAVNWRCPVCSAPKKRFQNIGPRGTSTGMQNAKYGFGVNTLNPGQKNLLIFGSLFVFFLLFLSLYGLQ